MACRVDGAVDSCHRMQTLVHIVDDGLLMSAPARARIRYGRIAMARLE